MGKLSVRDYGAKFRFLVGHKREATHGRLRDDIVRLLGPKESRSRDQLWVLALCGIIKEVKTYIAICEIYDDPTQDIQLKSLKDHRSKLSPSAHANWAASESAGPREDIGAAVAAIYGMACQQDDPTLLIKDRRLLWQQCDNALWKSWRNDTAEQFIKTYTSAIAENRLVFPERVRATMARQDLARRETPSVMRTSQALPESGRFEALGHLRRPSWAVWGGGLVALTLLAVLLAPRPPVPLREASAWVECMPGMGPVELGGGAEALKVPCPQGGLLPLDRLLVHTDQIGTIAQPPFEARFSPITLRGMSWRRTVWRASPSFARILTSRKDIAIRLACRDDGTIVTLENAAWGVRRLKCGAPALQLPLLDPRETEVAITVTSPDSTRRQTCSGFLTVFGKKEALIDPSRPCADWQERPTWTLPVRKLIEGLDLIQDHSTGLLWLADPYAFGSAWIWEPSAQWEFSELFQRMKDATGKEGWRLARPEEVIEAKPEIFANAAGDLRRMEGVARAPDCPEGARKVAISMVSDVSNAEATEDIALPCIFAGPDVGFWIVKAP